ncbi:GNAT family N-acetyltransferase [Paenibacillus lutimineralis]|uniref:GNAT family N-acetyltransferase n=1 Tax=Paenibacillus lutimineralis TaxID=2707005 RepID=A0A3S9UXN2_9BACL|nr:GNAT family N-acetyltransferase [Paenibacillus lutimineralis]AZS15095.1 GNAT family N-acetyltransferase [Paenibacillus lutimineralis]
MNFTVREMQTPDDYTEVADLLNYELSEETHADHLALEDSKIPAVGTLGKNESGLLTGHDRMRIVAVNEDEAIIGYGISWRAPWTAAGELNHWLIVNPHYRNQGIGAALYNTLEQWANGIGASKLNYEVHDDQDSSIAFSREHGYEQERHNFESVLELNSFDRSMFEYINLRYPILPLTEIDDPDREQRLYELYKETTQDIPGISGDYFDFHEWRKWTLELPESKPENILVALDGNKFIGVTHLLHFETANSMYNEYTGVRRDYRGQRIGLSLKLKAIELAVSKKIEYMRTNNDSLNAPMLTINRDRLKFEAVPGRYKMVKFLQQV